MAVRFSDLNCQKCSDAVKEIRGCEKETKPYYMEDEQFTRCPLKLIMEKTRMYFKIYNDIKIAGSLYNEGGIGDQSGKLFDIISIIDNEITRRQKNG